MSKELWLAAHEELVAEYMDEHPNADEDKVRDMMADRAQDRVVDRLAAAADAWKDEQKYRGL